MRLDKREDFLIIEISKYPILFLKKEKIIIKARMRCIIGKGWFSLAGKICINFYLRFIVPVTLFFSLELLWWLQIRWLHRSMELPCSLLTPKSRLGEILSHMPLLQGLFTKFILINLYNYMLLNEIFLENWTIVWWNIGYMIIR